MCSFQWVSSNPLGHNSSCSLCRANGCLGDCSFSLWKSFHVLTSHVQGCECCVYWFPFFCVTNILELFIWGSSINPIHFVIVQLLVFVALFIDTNQINQSHHLIWFQSMHQPNLPVQYKYLNRLYEARLLCLKCACCSLSRFNSVRVELILSASHRHFPPSSVNPLSVESDNHEKWIFLLLLLVFICLHHSDRVSWVSCLFSVLHSTIWLLYLQNSRLAVKNDASVVVWFCFIVWFHWLSLTGKVEWSQCCVGFKLFRKALYVFVFCSVFCKDIMSHQYHCAIIQGVKGKPLRSSHWHPNLFISCPICFPL